MFRKICILFILVLPVFAFIGCGSDEDEDPEIQASSRAYKGHENDLDMTNLVSAYPSVIGTRLDDCQACHTGEVENGVLTSSACDYCHKIMLDEGGSATGTLNSYGLAYVEAGRTLAAITSIKAADSDGDGFSNDEELQALRYPGSAQSQPGQATARLLTVNLAELQAMGSHSQFMLANTTKQQFDDYVTYAGVTVEELFDSLGIDLTGATGLTAIAPDGYQKSVPIEMVNEVFAQPIFYSGLDVATLGEDCGFVMYPEIMPDGLTHGAPIPGEHRLMLGYERDGSPMVSSYLDIVSGKIEGEGPFRFVVPQSNPGAPDRGLKYSPSGCDDGYDFSEDADHNAGAMVRGVMAIRIDPMPAGVEEFDYMNGGWAYIDANEVIIYGHNVQ